MTIVRRQNVVPEQWYDVKSEQDSFIAHDVSSES